MGSKPTAEVEPISHAKSLPTIPGIYPLYDSSGSVICVGQATNLKQEVVQALNRKMNFPVRQGPTLSKKAHPKYKMVATHISAYEVHSSRMRHNLEALLLRVFPNQSHNNKGAISGECIGS
jgi:excinuclease UvrABC nuclease subunit